MNRAYSTCAVKFGDNQTLLKALGYNHVIGVDVSSDMVLVSCEAGHQAQLAGEISDKEFDVSFFSHVIEHLTYPDIVDFFPKAIFQWRRMVLRLLS